MFFQVQVFANTLMFSHDSRGGMEGCVDNWVLHIVMKLFLCHIVRLLPMHVGPHVWVLGGWKNICTALKF